MVLHSAKFCEKDVERTLNQLRDTCGPEVSVSRVRKSPKDQSLYALCKIRIFSWNRTRLLDEGWEVADSSLGMRIVRDLMTLYFTILTGIKCITILWGLIQRHIQKTILHMDPKICIIPEQMLACQLFALHLKRKWHSSAVILLFFMENAFWVILLEMYRKSSTNFGRFITNVGGAVVH